LSCAHAKVDHAVGPDLELHAAVLRHAFLGDVEPGNDLDARGQLVLDDGGRARNLAQLAVDAEAHAVVVFVRFEVDVRCPHADGVQQHLVQEANNRRVLDFGDRLVVAVARGFGRDIVELELAADDAVDGFRGTDGGGLDHSRQLVVFGDDPVDAHLGGELDLFRRLLVGRIGCCNDQTVVALAEDDDAVRMAQLLVNQILRQALRVDGVQVEQRGAEGRGQGVGEVGCRDGAGAGQLRDEAGTATEGLLVDVLGCLGRKLAGRNQGARKPWEGNLRGFFNRKFGSGHSASEKDVKNCFTIIAEHSCAVNRYTATGMAI